MAELNKKVCIVQGANTGFGDCVVLLKHIVGAILLPGGTTFTPAQLLDFQQALKDGAWNPAKNSRFYPIHNFEQITDNSEDKNIQTLTYGGKYPLVEGDYDWTFQFLQGGMCLLKSLRKFNGSGRDVIFYDADGLFIGQKIGDNFAGIPLVFFHANKFQISDGSNVTNYSVQFVFKPKYLNDFLGFVETDFDPVQVKGVRDVALVEHASTALPDIEVQAFAGCDKLNMFEDYEAELAAITAWVVTIDGADVNITSVVANPTIQGWTITLDAVDPDYNIAGKVVVKMAPVGSIVGAEGFESNSITLA